MWTRRWFLRLGGLLGVTALAPRLAGAEAAAASEASTRIEEGLWLILRLSGGRYGSWDTPWERFRNYGRLRELLDAMTPRERAVLNQLPGGMQATVRRTRTRTAHEWQALSDAELKAWCQERAEHNLGRCIQRWPGVDGQ